METNEKRILVVDDDDAIRALLFTVLRRRGMKVDMARNGADALERCLHCHYSVILLDLMMPKVSGYEVLAHLEHEWRGERPIVLVLTAGTEPRNLNPAYVAGTIRKPFDIELLLDTLNGCLSSVVPRMQPEGCPPAESETTPKRITAVAKEDSN
jgi:DNA-binding response OmpR family regulator